ncbi:MAG: TonB-dependent receptor [Gammaproteobacteria bacterium]|nr:TonB-dependent receptor [Gammaproteobacteria bacterium]
MSAFAPTTALALLLAAGPVLAQSEDVFELSLEELSQVQVSVASRNQESTAAAPGSVTVFTREDIQRLGARRLGDLLNLVPGVQALFEAQEGRTNLLQGRGVPEAYGQSFLLLLDGKRLNEHYTGGFTLANRFIELGNVERVEVARGPGSALYGSNAFSGVINIVTSQDRRELELDLGSHRGRRAAAQYGAQGEDWQLAGFVAAYEDAGESYSGVFDRFGRQDRTRDPRRLFDAYVSGSYGGAFLTLRQSRHRLEDYYEFGRLADGLNEDMNESLLAQAGYRWESAGAWSGELALSEMRVSWEPLGRLALQGPELPADLINGAHLEYRSQELTADARHAFSADHRLNLGLNLERAATPEAASVSNYDPISGESLGAVRELHGDRYRFVGDQKRRILGVYLQDQYQWNENWSTTLGLRHDHFNDIGAATSPRLALIYTPGEADTFKLMHGRAYRAPGLGDLYDQEAGQTLGNPELEAITVRTTELAWLHQASAWQAGITLFDNHAENLLSGVPQPDGRTLVDNVGSNDNRGYELELAVEPGANWLIKLNYTRIAQNRTRGVPDASAIIAEDFGAPAFGSWILNYAAGDWNFNLNGYWRRALPAIADEGDYHPANAVINWRATPALGLQLAAYNLGDEAGAIPARSSGLGRRPDGRIERAVPLRGRELWLSLSYALD